jgi:hypothetical protein
MAATETPAWSTYWPSGILEDAFKKAGLNSAYPFLAVDTAQNFQNFKDAARKLPNSNAAKLASIFGSPEAYKAAADSYNLTNLQYVAQKKPKSKSAQKRLEEAQTNLVESTTLQPGTIYSDKYGYLKFADNKGRAIEPSSTQEHQKTGQTISLDFVLNNERFTFIPQNLVEKGWIKDDKQYYFDFLLDKNNFDSLTNDGSLVDLSGIGNFDTLAKENNISTKGFLVPITSKVADQARRPTKDSIFGYVPGSGKGDYNVGQIQGITLVNGNPTYVAQGFGPNATQARIQAANTLDYTGQNTTDESRFYVDWYKEGRSRLGSFGDFINDVVGSDLFKIAALGTGLYGLSTLAGAGAASAAGSGLLPSAAGITGLTPGAAGITGITAPAGFALAPSVGAGLVGAAGASELFGTPSYGLLDTAQFPTEGIKATASTTGGASAPFATTPAYSELTTVIPAGGGAATVPGLSVPSLSKMGGGTGLQVPVAGGTVTEMGFVPTGATPSLGDPSSFINNPDYLGSPVISEDYLGLTGADMPGGLSLKDALDYARQASQLLGGQQQQQQFGLFGGGQVAGGARQAGGVDYSGLLALLQGKAGVPGVSPLLSPVASPLAQQQNLLNAPMPQYQPLSPNLLG